MIAYLLALLVSPDDAIDRMTQYMANMKTLTVDLRFESAGGQYVGVGKLILEKPSSQRYTMNLGSSDYLFIANPKGQVEIEHRRRRYREFPSDARLTAPAGLLSDTPAIAFPLPLIVGDVYSILPTNTRFSLIGEREGPNGLEDQLSATYDTMMGRQTMILFIDKLGRLTRYELQGESREDGFLSMTISNYAKNVPVPASTFRLEYPLGYVPDGLTPHEIPLQPGDKIVLDEFLSADTGKKARLPAGGKGVLTVLFGADCEPSRRLIQAMNEAKGEIASAGLEVALILASPQAKADSGFPRFRVARGDPFEVFLAPGTPLTLSIDPNGIVRQVWFGFDPAGLAQLRKEWVESVKIDGKALAEERARYQGIIKPNQD